MRHTSFTLVLLLSGAAAAQVTPTPNRPPMLQSNGPAAPQNDVAFTQQHTSDDIREELALESQLCDSAVKRSSDAGVKAFARRVLDENKTLDAKAKGFAPDGSKSFPNAAFVGTRLVDNAKTTQEKIQALKGHAFDEYFLKQMIGHAEYDQQLGHQAYAMMSFPGISPVGRSMWDIANARVKDVKALAAKLHVDLGPR